MSDSDVKEKERIRELEERFIGEVKEAPRNRSRGRHWLRRQITLKRFVIILPLLLILSGYAAQDLYTYYGPGSCHSLGHNLFTKPTKVGLIDTLSFQYPDAQFTQLVGSSVKSAGLGFDYFTPSSLSLDTFVHLPIDGYSILILRTHIGYSNTSAPALQVAITTSEPYDNYRYVTDQINDRLTNVDVNGSFFFGLTPSFVSDRMCGQFPHTLILTMGCYGMNSTSIGESFIQKGAAAFVGWKGVVTVDQTDTAFETLVPLLLGGHTVSDAVQQVMGPGPIVAGEPILSYLQA